MTATFSLSASCAAALSLVSAMAAAQAVPPAVPVRAAPATFEIAAFDVTGVTRLDARAVEDAVYPFAGPGRAATDVEAARKALEDAYKKRGFESVLVEIPPQPNASFIQGIVALKVTEATIGRLRVVGSKYTALSVVLSQLPSLQEGQVPDLAAAQRELAEANRFPDREITPSIKAGRIPGTLDVDLRVKDSLPLHASVTVNNDHSAQTSDLRLVASARYSNLFQLGHTLTASYLVAPRNRRESEVISGSYLAPILNSRWTLLAFGYQSNSNIAALGGTAVLGNGYAIGARAIYRLPGTVEQSISFGADYKDFKEDIFVPSNDPARPDQTIQTPIAYVPLTLAYALQRVGTASALSLTLTATAGLRGLASGQATIQAKRVDAIGNFARLNLDVDYSRALPRDFVGSAKLSAQFADSALVTNEQFSLGGAGTVRGYFQSEGVGDDGVTGQFELRSPSLASTLGSFVDELRLFGFVDAGYVRVRSVLAEQTGSFTLVGAGAGARFQFLRYLRGDVAYGFALTDGNPTRTGDGLLVFSVKAEF